MFSIKLINLIDFFLTFFLMVLFLPLIIILMLLNILFLGFPIFYVSERIGLHGKKFNLIKFRSMKIKNIDNGPDEILTYGKLIRRLSLDETPQFFNILIGDMSLIGPRPLPYAIESQVDIKH